MDDNFLLPSEFLLLAVFATLPVWFLATLIQLGVYKIKNYEFRPHMIQLIVSVLVLFILITLLGVIFWVAVPPEWYESLRLFRPEGYFSYLYLFVLFPPMVFAALVSAPFVSYLILRKHTNT